MFQIKKTYKKAKIIFVEFGILNNIGLKRFKLNKQKVLFIMKIQIML